MERRAKKLIRKIKDVVVTSIINVNVLRVTIAIIITIAPLNVLIVIILNG